MGTSAPVDPGLPLDPNEEKIEKPEEQQSAKRSKPNRSLPSERLSFQKQLDVLRAYVAASSNGTRPCSLTEVASVVGLNSGSVSVANPFFASCGLIQRVDGKFAPSADVIAFQRAYEWDQDQAPQKLGALLKEQWFFQALSPRLSFGALDEDQALALLADGAAAGPEYKTNLRMLLEYLAAAGLIVREGGQIRLGRPAPTAPPTPQPIAQPVEHPKPTVPTHTIPSPSTSGRIQINVSIDVDMLQMVGWQPDRISAFFSGIAQVIAAKGGDAGK